MPSTKSNTPAPSVDEEYAERKLKITTFKAVKSTAPGKPGEVTWERLVSYLTGEHKPTKDKHALGLWCPVEFDGHCRKNECATLIHAFVGDFDNEIKPSHLRRLENPPAVIEVTKGDGKKVLKVERPSRIDNVLAVLPGIEGCWHTSFSHQPSWPKYRGVWLFSRGVTADEYGVIWAALDAKFAAAGIVLDPATKNVSRAWFRPANTEQFESGYMAGELLDVDSILRRAHENERRASCSSESPSAAPVVGAVDHDVPHEDRVRRAVAYTQKFPAAVSGQDGHGTTFRLACQLVRGFDLPIEDALRIMVEHYNPRCEPPWSDEELNHKVEDATNKGQRPAWGAHLRSSRQNPKKAVPSGEDERPVIKLDVDTDRVLVEAVDALALDADVFARGSRLVQVHDGDVGREAVEITATVLQVVHLARSAAWLRWDAKTKTWHPTTPPTNIAAAVHQLQRWPSVRKLMGIVDTPVMRADGTVLDTAGYDPSTGLLYSPKLDFGTIPESPSNEEVDAAKALLVETVKDFPFVPSGFGCWLALLMSYFGRSLFSGPAPGFVVDANTRGSRKTLLVAVIGRIVLGAPIPVTTPTVEEEELRKRITATLMKGSPIVLVDNLPINQALGNATWDLLLTSEVWEDRILGVSSTVVVPNSTVWVFTGNNVQVKGDTTRRILHVRLESPLENPERRAPEEFTHSDLATWVVESRVALVRACLVLLRAWVVAGRPRGSVSLGSYPIWSSTIGACIEWLGYGDLTKTQMEYEERNASGSGDASDLRPLVMAWRTAFNDEPKTAGEVLDIITKEDRRVETERRRIEKQQLAGEIDLDEGEVSDHRYADLREAIMQFAPAKRGGLPKAAWLGRRLSGVLKRVVSGHRFEVSKDRNDVSHWRVVAVAAGASAGACGGTAGARSENAPASIVASSQQVEPFAGACGGISGTPERPRDHLTGSADVDLAADEDRPRADRENILPPLPPQQHSTWQHHSAKGAGASMENAPALAPALAPACPRKHPERSQDRNSQVVSTGGEHEEDDEAEWEWIMSSI